MRASSPRSRPRSSRSWRRWARCRPCSRAASRSPRGASRGRIGSELELFEERGYANTSPGLALIRDGNGTRSFETLLRYRGAAMAEFWRALKTLKALQAEQARDAGQAIETGRAEAVVAPRPAPRRGRRASQRARPNEPERRSVLHPSLEYLLREPARARRPARARCALAAERTRGQPHATY